MPPTTARRSFQSSELSRHSKSVFAAVGDGSVQITRRDGEALVLMAEREAASRDMLLQVAGRLLTAATAAGGRFSDHLADAYPWMLALSTEDREECATDVLNAARAAFETGHAHLAVAELTSWRETALAIAAGLGAEPVQWLYEDEPVERP
ncbi:MAG: prevent-host-death protein [Demequina sp.]